MDHIDMHRLKSGEVNLGVRIGLVLCKRGTADEGIK